MSTKYSCDNLSDDCIEELLKSACDDLELYTDFLENQNDIEIEEIKLFFIEKVISFMHYKRCNYSQEVNQLTAKYIFYLYKSLNTKENINYFLFRFTKNTDWINCIESIFNEDTKSLKIEKDIHCYYIFEQFLNIVSKMYTNVESLYEDMKSKNITSLDEIITIIKKQDEITEKVRSYNIKRIKILEEAQLPYNIQELETILKNLETIKHIYNIENEKYLDQYIYPILSTTHINWIAIKQMVKQYINSKGITRIKNTYLVSFDDLEIIKNIVILPAYDNLHIAIMNYKLATLKKFISYDRSTTKRHSEYYYHDIKKNYIKSETSMKRSQQLFNGTLRKSSNLSNLIRHLASYESITIEELAMLFDCSNKTIYSIINSYPRHPKY